MENKPSGRGDNALNGNQICISISNDSLPCRLQSAYKWIARICNVRPASLAADWNLNAEKQNQSEIPDGTADFIDEMNYF